jgi:hypothetical protein
LDTSHSSSPPSSNANSGLNSSNIDEEDREEIKELVKDTKVAFESFEVIKILGSGAFGKVFLVRKRDDNSVYAMKALKKRNLIIKK